MYTDYTVCGLNDLLKFLRASVFHISVPKYRCWRLGRGVCKRLITHRDLFFLQGTHDFFHYCYHWTMKTKLPIHVLGFKIHWKISHNKRVLLLPWLYLRGWTTLNNVSCTAFAVGEHDQWFVCIFNNIWIENVHSVAASYHSSHSFIKSQNV